MDVILQILNNLKPDIDFASNAQLIDNGILDSFEMITLISECEEAFHIEIPPTEITTENLNSAADIWNMIQRYLK